LTSPGGPTQEAHGIFPFCGIKHVQRYIINDIMTGEKFRREFLGQIKQIGSMG
jgi:hypothetical protein